MNQNRGESKLSASERKKQRRVERRNERIQKSVCVTCAAPLVGSEYQECDDCRSKNRARCRTSYNRFRARNKCKSKGCHNVTSERVYCDDCRYAKTLERRRAREQLEQAVLGKAETPNLAVSPPPDEIERAAIQNDELLDHDIDKEVIELLFALDYEGYFDHPELVDQLSQICHVYNVYKPDEVINVLKEKVGLDFSDEGDYAELVYRVRAMLTKFASPQQHGFDPKYLFLH